MLVDGLAYRQVFVGREDELGQLEAAFLRARSGHGALAIVSGEPGVGKSALCDQFAMSISSAGGQALVGRCYEEGSLTLPYLPFAEALGSYVLAQDPAKLRRELGGALADVARSVPDLCDKLHLRLREPGDPDEDRWRLYQAILAFLRSAAASRPLLLVLEDLQWAERGTLDLLVHLARNLEGTELLLVGTYRDVEVDRAHPLTGALAELGRVARIHRLELMRLGPAEVEHMLAVLGGHEVAPSFAGAVYEQTDGNPLFVQEVYRDLVEAEQRVSLTEQAVQPAQRTPAGLRHVIAMRLSRLSPACNQLLTAAAVIGRTFSLGTLQRVVALDDESLFTALETAVRVGLLEEQTGPGLVRYRFAHALFRQTLYEDLIAPRRLRLHQQVVRALEDEYGARVEEHAAELAAHYAQSTSSNDLAEAIRYWRMAAARANRACAYSDAARYLEEALSIQKAVDPDDLRARCDLLLALAHALGPAGEPQRAADIVAEEAFRLAEAIGDDERASYACFIHFEAASRYGARLATRGTAGSRWAERADRHAPLGSLARIYADLALGDASYVPRMGDDPGRSWRLHQRALEAARAMDDPRLLLECAAHMLPGGRLGYWTEALRLAQEVAALPLDGISAWTAAISLQSCGAMFLAWGQRDRAERLWRSLGELADQTPDPAIVAHAVVHRIILATLDGDLQAAVDATERFEVLAAEAGGSLRGLQFSAGYGMRALSYLGRMEAALESVQRWAMLAPRPSRDTRLGVALAQVGRWDQAQEILDRILARWRARPPGSDIVAAHVQQVLELAILLRDQSGAAFVSGLLAPVAHIINDRGCDLTCIARHLGDAAALLGDVDQASEYYDHALEMCRRVGFRPEIALIHLGIAELGVRDPRHPTRTSPRQRAARSLVEPDLRVPLDHLDFAIQEFQAMGMRPALERALAFRGAARPDTATPSQSTYPGKLTEREVAVLRLIAVGKRNREIATALSLSPHTVAHHITSVLTKTGAANRAEAASYATRHGLVRGA